MYTTLSMALLPSSIALFMSVLAGDTFTLQHLNPNVNK